MAGPGFEPKYPIPEWVKCQFFIAIVFLGHSYFCAYIYFKNWNVNLRSEETLWISVKQGRCVVALKVFTICMGVVKVKDRSVHKKIMIDVIGRWTEHSKSSKEVVIFSVLKRWGVKQTFMKTFTFSWVLKDRINKGIEARVWMTWRNSHNPD